MKSDKRTTSRKLGSKRNEPAIKARQHDLPTPAMFAKIVGRDK